MPKREHTRRPRRIDTSVDAVLTSSDGHRSSVTIRDISASGFRIELSDELLFGEQVVLTIGTREQLRAEIRWALGNEAGGVFLDRQNLPDDPS